ncbi:MAG: ABC transporter ATP-binding protein [Deltaproteobacteria bacterium]|nr:ABC transporter ATP-binding protein [Deltaproteobacteria bacterium]
MLKVCDLHVHYGAIHALKGLTLEINSGEIVALIGSNGAGKTTLLRTISGLIRPSAGSIEFTHRGQKCRLNKIETHKIVSLGLAQVPEGRMIFQNLSVLENLELGAYPSNNKKNLEEDLEKNFLLFPRLKERLKQNAGTLSGGEQQMLAISRALMSRPSLLLLDEPSLGIAPALVQQIFSKLVEINEMGTTIFLVEQDAFLALETAHRAYVLETGQFYTQGKAEELLHDSKIRQAYLGEVSA